MPGPAARTFKTKEFARLARKSKIPDDELCRAAAELEQGKGDDLGGNVWKKRVNQNRSRAIVAAKPGDFWLFAYLFDKADRENIDHDELLAFGRWRQTCGPPASWAWKSSRRRARFWRFAMTAKTNKRAEHPKTLARPSRAQAAARKPETPARSAVRDAARKPKSAAIGAVLALAGDMQSVGLIDKKTMRSYEDLCLEPPEYTAEDVVRIRRKVHASQGFFARSLNVSASAIQQWESGAKRPSGSAARLLAVVDKHGLEVLA